EVVGREVPLERRDLRAERALADEAEDGGARDPREDVARRRRRERRALDDEDVRGPELGDVAVDVEQEGVIGAGGDRLPLRDDLVQVVVRLDSRVETDRRYAARRGDRQ